jgi:hypothetical protein
LRALRLRIELANIVSGLASAEAWIEQGEISPADLPLVAEILIDGAVNAITGPASEAALARLRPSVPDNAPEPVTTDLTKVAIKLGSISGPAAPSCRTGCRHGTAVRARDRVELPLTPTSWRSRRFGVAAGAG